MIKLLVSELRAKDLVSPRYDSRKIVPGAQHMTHSAGNPFVTSFCLILTILLSGIHIFAQPESSELLSLLPFISFVPFFSVLWRTRKSVISDMYGLSLVVFVGIGVFTALRYHIGLTYGFMGGLFGGLMFPTFLIPVWLCFNDVLSRSVAIICAWTTIEYALAWLFGTAMTLPIQLYRVPFLLQPISIFGTASADALLIASNWFLGTAVAQSGERRRLAIISWFSVMVVWIVLAWGCWRSLLNEDTVSVRISTISPGKRFKGDLADLVNMTTAAYRDGAEYIVWPEVYIHPERIGDSCESYVRTKVVPKLYPNIQAYLVVGCEQAYVNSTCTVGNIAVTLSPNGTILGTYGKQHPVTMIGEQSCFRNGYRKYDAPGLSFSTLICYDSDFEDSTAIVSDMGSSLVLTPSEDWYVFFTHSMSRSRIGRKRERISQHLYFEQLKIESLSLRAIGAGTVQSSPH